MTDALISSTNVEALVARRNAIVDRCSKANVLWSQAMELGKAAPIAGVRIDFDLVATLRTNEGRDAWLGEDRAIAAVTEKVDSHFWRALVEGLGLHDLMDSEAKKQWDEANIRPPLFTVENIRSTVAHLYDQRGTMFDRGVVNLFRKLSWDYRTNNPVKFGKRLVLTYMVEGGPWRHARATFDGTRKLDDLLRVMAVLAGHPEPEHKVGVWSQLQAQQWPAVEARAVVAVLGKDPSVMFELRGFKNGNAHLTFVREDLVDKMNAIIAKHHPNALPPSREP